MSRYGQRTRVGQAVSDFGQPKLVINFNAVQYLLVAGGGGGGAASTGGASSGGGGRTQPASRKPMIASRARARISAF